MLMVGFRKIWSQLSQRGAQSRPLAADESADASPLRLNNLEVELTTLAVGKRKYITFADYRLLTDERSDGFSENGLAIIKLLGETTRCTITVSEADQRIYFSKSPRGS